VCCSARWWLTPLALPPALLFQAAAALLSSPALLQRWDTALTRWQRQCLPALPAWEGLDGLATLWRHYLALHASLFATYDQAARQV
jgi:hypothetical protein